MTISSIRIGTRKTQLALKQTELVVEAIKHHYPSLTIHTILVDTLGDQIQDKPLPEIGGKGVFTATLEKALLAGELDFAVHSLKDLPITPTQGLTNGAVLARADVRDVFISKHKIPLEALPKGARIGTSSPRRKAQLLRYRPDLQIESVRGSVMTRIQKALAPDGIYDGIVLAMAGISRLEQTDHITEILPLSLMLPAPGQGALAVQCRDDAEWREFLAPIYHQQTALETNAERGFLSALGGGCALPIAAHGEILEQTIRLVGRIIAHDGAQIWEWEVQVPLADSLTSGQRLADELRAKGATWA